MNDYRNIILTKTTITPNTILEIGSRDGDDAEHLRNLFQIPQENVWIVEPNPIQNVNIKKKYPNINLITSPIFNVETPLIFNCVDVSDQILNGVSSLMGRVDKLYDKINTIKLELTPILGSTLLDMINQDIDLCKIDVEGATYEVIESFGEKLNKIKSIHLESEHRIVWDNQKLYEDISSLLNNLGFKQVYFQYCGGDTLQSDSIWVQAKYLK